MWHISMPGVNTAVLLDSGELLIVHEHAIDASAFPASSKVGVEEWLATIDYKRHTYLKIAPECLCTIIRDEDQRIFATFAITNMIVNYFRSISGSYRLHNSLARRPA